MNEDLVAKNARRLASLGHYRQALGLLREVASKDVELSLLEGKILAHQGSYKAALETLQRAAEADPDSVRVRAAIHQIQRLMSKGRSPRLAWRAASVLVGPAVVLLGFAGVFYTLGSKQPSVTPAERAPAPGPDLTTQIRSLLEQHKSELRPESPAKDVKAERATLQALVKQQEQLRDVLAELASKPNTDEGFKHSYDKFVQETQTTDVWLARRIKQLEAVTQGANGTRSQRAVAHKPVDTISQEAQLLAPLEAADDQTPPSKAPPAAPTGRDKSGIGAPSTLSPLGPGQRSVP